MNPDDPNGDDDVLVDAPEVHLPIDQPFKVLLRSNDVLHNFFVPEFRAKMDAVPGMVTYLWFTPIRAGRYEILCAELCGTSHHAMRGFVTVDTQEDFDAWLTNQPTWAQMRDGVETKAYSALAQRGRQVAETNGCLACHTLNGKSNGRSHVARIVGQHEDVGRRLAGDGRRSLRNRVGARSGGQVG